MKKHKEGSALIILLLLTSIVMMLGINMYNNATHLMTIAIERQKQLHYYYLTRALLEYAKACINNRIMSSETQSEIETWPFSVDTTIKGRMITHTMPDGLKVLVQVYNQGTMVGELEAYI